MSVGGRLAAAWRALSGVQQAYDPAKERRIYRTGQGSDGWVFASDSYAGKTVTADSALQLSAVFDCVRITAQGLASLPLKIYRKTADGGREEIDDHPLADLLSLDPNADQTAFEFWEAMAARAVLNGNGIAHKRYTGKFLSALVPIEAVPTRRSDGELVYRTWDRGQVVDLPRDEVFHVKGFGLGGDVGLSAIRYGAQTFGTAMAAEETAGKMFSNGMQANGVLTTDRSLQAPQREQLQNIMKQYASSSNAGKLMILEAGLKYAALTINPEDAQLLETRRFHIEEVCRWFGVPPIMIGHAGDGQTMWGSGVEQILLSWLVLGINPLAQRIERRIRKQLVTAVERRRTYAEFNREALLQMDSKAKAEFLASMTQNGLMSRKEGRAKLNLSATGQPGEDMLTAQTNLAPLGQLGANAVRPT
ncbi:phage portal protein [Phenylobacterium sp.]|uniref:phage portal protein n=1 Tax=Phenylobacterium sp. TaxID=1871053 RepID=UPI003918D3A4